MKKIFTLFSAIFFPLFVFSQQAMLKGKITEESTGEPIIGANVILSNGVGAATDIDGNYKISVDPGTYTVTIRFIGFTTIEKQVTLAAGETKELDVKMSEANTELETVVVSAGKYEQKLEELTVSMVVLKPALLENKNTLNVETIIEQVPGVTIQDGQVSIRGGSGFAYGAGSRVQLLVDELPLLAADAGDVKWNGLPVENIEQIEVIKGASSVLFGSSALNGVVNIRTGFAKDKPETKVSLTGGIYNNPRRDSIKWWDTNPYYTGLNFYHAQKFGQFDLVVGGAGFSDQGYREDEYEHRGRMNVNTRYRSKKVEGLSYGVNANYQYSKAGIFIIWQDSNNVYRPYGGADPENNPNSTISINYGTRFNVDPYITYFNKNGVKHNLRTRYYLTNNINNTNQGSLAQMYYGEYQFSKKTKKDFNMTLGVAGYYSEIQAELYGDHYGSNVAVFGQFDKKINRLNLSFGMRAEYFKIDSTETESTYRIIRGADTSSLPFQPVIRAGVNYQLFEHTHVRASFGQGYRFPSIAEKYVATSVGALNIFPNPSVEAESGWSSEIGVKQGIKIGKWNGYIDVAGFWTEYQNMVEFTFGVYNPDSIPLNLNPSNPGYITNWIGFRAQNAENARITGVDVEIIGTGKILKDLSITTFTGYTYMNPITLNDDPAYRESFSDTTTNMLKYRYRHLAKADVQFDYKKVFFGFSARYNSYMQNIDATFENLIVPIGMLNLPLGDYILPGLPRYRAKRNKGDIVFDARIGMQITKQIRASFVVNNVLNREYMGRPGDVQAPRTTAIQLIGKF